MPGFTAVFFCYRSGSSRLSAESGLDWSSIIFKFCLLEITVSILMSCKVVIDRLLDLGLSRIFLFSL